MFNCEKCRKKNCTTICDKVNKILKDSGIKSAEWIRPERSSKKREDGLGKAKEIPFSALRKEDKKEIRLKYGEISEI